MMPGTAFMQTLRKKSSNVLSLCLPLVGGKLDTGALMLINSHARQCVVKSLCLTQSPCMAIAMPHALAAVKGVYREVCQSPQLEAGSITATHQTQKHSSS